MDQGGSALSKGKRVIKKKMGRRGERKGVGGQDAHKAEKRVKKRRVHAGIKGKKRKRQNAKKGERKPVEKGPEYTTATEKERMMAFYRLKGGLKKGRGHCGRMRDVEVEKKKKFPFKNKKTFVWKEGEKGSGTLKNQREKYWASISTGGGSGTSGEEECGKTLQKTQKQKVVPAWASKGGKGRRS